MRYVGLALLALFFSSLALADKREEWKAGCVSAISQNSSKVKLSLDGKTSCSDLESYYNRKNMWAEISSEQPKFDGCVDASNLMLDLAKVQDPVTRKTRILEFCFGA